MGQGDQGTSNVDKLIGMFSKSLISVELNDDRAKLIYVGIDLGWKTIQGFLWLVTFINFIKVWFPVGV